MRFASNGICNRRLVGKATRASKLGGVEFVSKHFEPIVLGIVIVSLLPVVLIVFRGWQKRRAALKADVQAS